MKQVVVFLLLVAASTADAAFERTVQGSRCAAMGGACAAVGSNEWAAFTNPAALRTIGARSLALFYAPQIFEIKELSNAAASYIEPTSFGTFALSASRFGLDLYNEARAALSYGDAIAEGVSFGVTLNYYSLSIQNYGSAGTFGVDVGALVDVSDNVQWGFVAFNLNAAKIGAEKEKLPQVFSTGVAYSPFGEATLAVGIRKDLRFPVEVHVGVEYEFIKMIALRAGTASEPSMMNAGVGIRYDFFRLDYAFSSHAELGITHLFSLALNVGEF
jgi:hypothetical protein